ncbi:MAG: hypothetical protein WC263_00360 [Candidatus Micrarchaeia archaeon]
MKMGKTCMLVLFGFLTWMLPFFASFFFYDPAAARMTIDNDFFKSIMVVFSALVGTALLVKYFDAVKKDYVKEGLVAGVTWAAMNWALDFVVLVPMMKVDTPAYFMSIGIRYLMVPIIAVGMGMAAENAKARKK